MVQLYPKSYQKSIKKLFKKEIDFQSFLKNEKIQSYKTQNNQTNGLFSRKFSSFNTSNVSDLQYQSVFKMDLISDEKPSVKCSIVDSTKYLNTLNAESTKQLLRESKNTNLKQYMSQTSTSRIDIPKFSAFDRNKSGKSLKDFYLKSGFTSIRLLSNLKSDLVRPKKLESLSVINNKEHIESIDNQLINLEEDSFDTKTEIKKSRAEIIKLEELKNQLIWVDRERIK